MHKRLVFQICLTAALGAAAHAVEPLGYWPFDGHLRDAVGTAHGTFSGGEPVYVPGRLGQAIRFDGTDDYVTVMVRNVTAYTLTAWVMPERTSAANIVVRTSASGPGTHWSHQVRIAGSGTFEHYLYDGTQRSVLGTTPVETDTWYFVAISAANNGRLRLYVNGQEEGTSTTLGTLWSAGDRFQIGSNSSGFGWFQGKIDDVRIYEQQLTEAEVTEVMAEAPFPFAFAPQPKNGAMLEQTSVVLQWHKGDRAVSHKVYLGESFDAVDGSTVEAIATTEAQLSVGLPGGPYPAGLAPGQTYYWRVDEINEAHPDSPWKGPVWSFWVRPLKAWNPSPAAGATYVDPDQDLTWSKGQAALFHTIYFGESLEQVGNATGGTFMTVNPVYDPGTLEPGKTYYWRVDEFAPPATHKGDVWSFTTRPVIPVTNDPNLLLSWTLDEGLGAAGPADWSGRGRSGTMVGAPLWVRDGYHDGALVLDSAKKSYLYTRMAPAMPSQTVCLWVKTLKTSASILGWANALPTSGTHDRELYLNASRTVSWRIWDGAAKIVTSVQPVSDGAWHHIAGVYTSGRISQLYVDGVLQGSAQVGNVYNSYSAAHLTVGIESQMQRYLDGVIDDVRVYNKPFSEEELRELMRGDPRRAWEPEPARSAIVDIRAADTLRWSAGEAAASHDVYFGRDRAAVAAADKGSPALQGNRKVTNLSLAGLVEFGGGDYYWRIDEVAADGSVHVGDIWKFTVADYLIVDDFESYTDDEGNRIYETWIDGWTNGTSSTVGYLQAPFAERTIVHGGWQAMPLDYNNINAPYYAEADQTWAAAQDWTAHGVTALTLYFQGRAANGPEPLYVALKDSAGKTATVVHPNAQAACDGQWTEWKIPLEAFTGVNAGRIKTMTIGLGQRAKPTPGGAGRIYLDDLRLTRP